MPAATSTHATARTKAVVIFLFWCFVRQPVVTCDHGSCHHVWWQSSDGSRAARIEAAAGNARDRSLHATSSTIARSSLHLRRYNRVHSRYRRLYRRSVARHVVLQQSQVRGSRLATTYHWILVLRSAGRGAPTLPHSPKSTTASRQRCHRDSTVAGSRLASADCTPASPQLTLAAASLTAP